jgi:hypothetical protein
LALVRVYTINEPVVAFTAEDRWHTSKAGVEAIVFYATRAATESIDGVIWE